MPLLENDRAIKEYFNQVKEQYSTIDFDTFSRVCKAPFNFVKESIRSGNIPIIMFKYFGKFRINKGRLTNGLDTNEKVYAKGKRSEAKYNFVKNLLTGYLKKIEDYEAENPTDIEEGETSD